MIHELKVLDNFLGKGIVNALIETLYNQCEDFPETHQKYLTAIEKLREQLGADAKRDIDKYVVAIEQKCSALLFYAGMLGLQMNIDHFINPMAPTAVWKQVDFDDFLRVDLAYNMPLYKAASRYMEKFPYEIPEAIDQAISEYETDLEICGLKLAHYYGYLMGDDLLPHCIPGYRSDASLGFRYKHLLEKYFGQPLSTDQWEGCIFVKEWKIAPIPEVDPQDDIVYREEIWNDTVG